MAITRITNRVTRSPHYAKILREYNDRFARDGKVVERNFYNEVIKPLIPKYSLQGWYDYIRRYRTSAGALVDYATLVKNSPSANAVIEENKIEQTNITLAQAQNLALRKALNIGLGRLNELELDPSKLTFKDAIDLIFKSMKAQDSRARVVKEIRQDVREQEKFEKLLDDEAYGSSG